MAISHPQIIIPEGHGQGDEHFKKASEMIPPARAHWFGWISVLIIINLIHILGD